MPTTTTLQKRSIDSADEVREFEKGRMDIVTLDDVVFARTVFHDGVRGRSVAGRRRPASGPATRPERMRLGRASR